MGGIRSRSRPWGIAAALAVVGLSAAAWRLAPGWLAAAPSPALAAYERGDYREARTRAAAVLARKPDDPEAMTLMARASGRLGVDETAQALYGRIGEGKMQAEDFAVLGSILERQGQAAAVTVLERAAALDPGHSEALSGLARLHAREGRLPEAIDAARKLASRPGWESRGSLILGVLEAEDANPEAAAEAIDRALLADPALAGGITSPASARKLLAASRLRMARPADALEALKPIGPDPEASWLASRAHLQLGDLGKMAGDLAVAGDFGRDDPTRPEPAPYLGAAACAACHPAIFKAQRGSRHARTFSGPSDLARLSLPASPLPDTALPGTSHSLKHEGDSTRLATRSGGRELEAVVAFAVGSGDRGMTMVARDAKGLARVCRVSSYLDGTVWDQTSHVSPPEPGDPDAPLGRPMSAGAEVKCVACHVTSLRAARDRRAPEGADRGIGCERCHGPGGNHRIAVELAGPDPAIARPSRASAAQITKLCGACHQADDPTTRETDPRFVRFQATTFPMSRCYADGPGTLSCVTCHDPHKDAETDPAAYERRCLACHSADKGPETPLIGATAGRTVACPVNPATGCIGCHMPKVAGAAPHALFTDHQIRVHSPAPRPRE